MDFFLWISCYFSFVFFHSFPLSFLYFHPYAALSLLFYSHSFPTFPFSFICSLPSFLDWPLLPLFRNQPSKIRQQKKKTWEMKGRSCQGALSKNCFRFTHFHDQNDGKCISDIPLFFFSKMFWGAHPRPTMQKRRRWLLCFLSKSVPIPLLVPCLKFH